jgi:hypothetical protein
VNAVVDGPAVVVLPGLVILGHGGPLAVGVLGGTPDTYQTAGLERGTATSTSTRPGTTSERDVAETVGTACNDQNVNVA